ncbi:class I SAM-dependent methyltransferase [Enterovibrio sp. ZSDZ35]|uniref:Class I SAM-dependent methyltransferase n=1 Tax=Enterovibrio qingdaonensis TaxID=2899818 RepID=A0ABT5QIV3_9GAMM|nr:class I SAM-dependent methyltransferase [Enterovibrio sp. ZSDZ35]MDD1780920.1 class I SAM-dependent methyltransferase [Enterovibrio sp. ZSDZ35]
MKSDMYSTFAQQYDTVVQDNIYNALLERPTLQSMLDSVEGKDVIDLGCGSGIYAEYFLAQNARSVTCLDFSDEMVDIVESKFKDRVRAYQQDLSKGLPKEADDSYDVAVSPLVIHYIEDLNVVMEEAYRVLRAGGVFAFSTHHPFADFECSTTGNYFDRELVKEEWNTVGEPVQVTFYRRSLTEITDAITDAGFSITKMSEGQVSEEAKLICEETYERLRKNPNFIFFKCQK